MSNCELIDIEADTPIERVLVGLLYKHRIPFEAQSYLFGGLVRYSVQEQHIQRARELLYQALHPPKMGVIAS